MYVCVQWFEEKTLQLETLDVQLKMLQSSIDALVLHRRGKVMFYCICIGHLLAGDVELHKAEYRVGI
jgi:hypothetical protein